MRGRRRKEGGGGTEACREAPREGGREGGRYREVTGELRDGKRGELAGMRSESAAVVRRAPLRTCSCTPA